MHLLCTHMLLMFMLLNKYWDIWNNMMTICTEIWINTKPKLQHRHVSCSLQWTIPWSIQWNHLSAIHSLKWVISVMKMLTFSKIPLGTEPTVTLWVFSIRWQNFAMVTHPTLHGSLDDHYPIWNKTVHFFRYCDVTQSSHNEWHLSCLLN